MFQDQLQEIGTIGMAIYVLIEIFKRAGFPSKYSGVLSLFFGLAIGMISFIILGKPWYQGLVQGFWGAASASGVYSSSKAVFTPTDNSSASGAISSSEKTQYPSC